MKEKIDALVLALRAGSRALAFASVCSSIFLKDRKKKSTTAAYRL